VRPIAAAAAAEHGVPLDLVLGVIQIESSFRPQARSHAGAAGLMQLMPRTAASLARRLGLDRYRIDDPEFNVSAGTLYLALLLEQFDDDVRLALASYNTGPARVMRWRRAGRDLAPPVARYVAAVQRARQRFRSLPEPPDPSSAVARNVRGPDPAAVPPTPRSEPGTAPASGLPHKSAVEPQRSVAATDSPTLSELDRAGLKKLLQRKERLYGERPDEPVPDLLPKLGRE
jgi:hypothetical protein